MTRQEVEYLDAEVEMLKKHIEEHGCSECDDDWCCNNSSLLARIRYAQLYGCICGTCCKLCSSASDCGFDSAVPCSDCRVDCGSNPNYN